jgi:hypothetical protein
VDAAEQLGISGTFQPAVRNRLEGRRGVEAQVHGHGRDAERAAHRGVA